MLLVLLAFTPLLATGDSAPLEFKPQDTWQCSVCKHVYDAVKDGGGVSFEQLPDSWKCPVCGAAKSAYKKISLVGQGAWVQSESDTWQCSVCKHVYDAKKDGGGVPFEQLPDSWKCPVCGAAKSAYKKTSMAGRDVWVHSESDSWQCSVCKHVYDAKKDGGGVPFEQLPDSWTCPVCGAAKSAYKKVSVGGQDAWVHNELTVV